MQEAFEANSMAAEQRYMRTMRSEAFTAKPDTQKGTDAQTHNQLCSVVFDVEQQRRMHVLTKPVYAVSPDGQKATSFAFDRLDAVEAGERLAPPSCTTCTVCILCALCFLQCLACCASFVRLTSLSTCQVAF